MPDLGQGKNYKFTKTAEMATGQFYTYETNPTFTDPLQVVNKAYVDASPVSHLEQDNCFFVGKAGNNTNGGRSEDDALFTIPAAIALANALIPSVTNQFKIYVIDAGVYTGNFTIGEFIHVIAPGAKIVGTVTISTTGVGGNPSLRCNELYSTGSNAALNFVMIGGDLAYINVIGMFNCTAGPGMTGAAGTVMMDAGRIQVDSSAIADSSFTGLLHLRVNVLRGTSPATIAFDLSSASLYLAANSIITDGLIFRGNGNAHFRVISTAVESLLNKVYEIVANDSFSLKANDYGEFIVSTSTGGAKVSLDESVGLNSKIILKNTDGIDVEGNATFQNELIADVLSLNIGTFINEISIDGTLGGDSDDAVPTEKAIKTYVDNLPPPITELDAAIYGDFNNVGWISLVNGSYAMTATSAQLSNTPFDVDAAQTYYIFINNGNKTISTVPYISQIFYVFKESVSGSASLSYSRLFKTNIADFLTRGFSGENSVQTFASLNSAAALSFALTAGNAKNLLDFLLESGESLKLNDGFRLLDTSSAQISGFLDETNDKFVFPSNFKTAGKLFCSYTIRIKVSGTLPAPAGEDVEFQIRLRRAIDDSIISTLRIIKVLSLSLDESTATFSTFVNTETDPFVLDGAYIDMFSPAGSKTLTITDVSVLISGSF